jgi:hypothetical protein
VLAAIPSSPLGPTSEVLPENRSLNESFRLTGEGDSTNLKFFSS